MTVTTSASERARDGVASSPPTVAPARPRIASLDIIRGAVMVLMAIDHVRVYVAAEPLAGLDRISAGLFVTRWITHFCAPAFVFLAGTGAYLYARRTGSAAAGTRLLLTRGLWLIVMEMTVVRLGWTFNLDYATYLLGGVIWMLGWCMVLLAALVRLPVAAIALLGTVIVAGHNLFGPRLAALAGSPGDSGFAWLGQVLYLGGPVQLGLGGPVLAVLYTIVPWIGVMALGYAFGRVMELDPARRRAWCLGLGLGAIALFLVLRGVNLYGDPRPWGVHRRGAVFSAFSFVNTAKYPASLLFLLMTLGPAIALIPALERTRHRASEALAVFGRVPFFFYLLHLPLIHGIAALLAVVRQGVVDPWLTANHPMMAPPLPEGLGYGVPMLYLIWAMVVVLLYVPCRWFSGVKARRRDWWLGYL